MKALFKTLFKILLIGSAIVATYFGIFSLIRNEEASYPKYIIKVEDKVYRTDTFNIDSNNVIHFTDIRYRLFGNPKTSKVEIHDRYTITEKYEISK